MLLQTVTVASVQVTQSAKAIEADPQPSKEDWKWEVCGYSSERKFPDFKGKEKRT